MFCTRFACYYGRTNEVSSAQLIRSCKEALSCLQELQYRISLQEPETRLKKTTVEYLTRGGKRKNNPSLADTGRPNSQVIASVAALPKTKQNKNKTMRRKAISNFFTLFQQRRKSRRRKRTDGKQKTARPELHYGSLFPSCISRMFRPTHAIVSDCPHSQILLF
jgi:hypothetical protein